MSPSWTLPRWRPSRRSPRGSRRPPERLSEHSERKQENSRRIPSTSRSFLVWLRGGFDAYASGEPSFRLAPEDTFYDISGHCFFPAKEDQHYLLAYANSSLVALLKKVFNSSFHFQCGDLAKIIVPVLNPEARRKVETIAIESVDLSKSDWNAFESSWDFRRHPLL